MFDETEADTRSFISFCFVSFISRCLQLNTFFFFWEKFCTLHILNINENTCENQMQMVMCWMRLLFLFMLPLLLLMLRLFVLLLSHFPISPFPFSFSFSQLICAIVSDIFFFIISIYLCLYCLAVALLMMCVSVQFLWI